MHRKKSDGSLIEVLQEYITLLKTQRDILVLDQQYETSIHHDKHDREVEWVVNKKYFQERYIVA